MTVADQENLPERGAPVARRAMLGMLGAGVAGVAAAPWLQRGWENFLGAASQADPTGLTGVLPNPGASATTASSARCRARTRGPTG